MEPEKHLEPDEDVEISEELTESSSDRAGITAYDLSTAAITTTGLLSAGYGASRANMYLTAIGVATAATFEDINRGENSYIITKSEEATDYAKNTAKKIGEYVSRS